MREPSTRAQWAGAANLSLRPWSVRDTGDRLRLDHQPVLRDIRDGRGAVAGVHLRADQEGYSGSNSVYRRGEERRENSVHESQL